MRLVKLVGLVLIFGFLVATRFVWLDKFPAGLNHDEADVVLSAKTYKQQGTDVSGVAFPRSLIYTRTEAGLSGLPSVFISPWIGFVPTSLTAARLPFVVINLLTGLIFALIIYLATRSKIFVGIFAFVYLINPWSFLYSRATTEAPVALLFLALALLLLFAKRGTKIFWSLPFFIFAFLSYFGAKPLMPLVVVGSLILHFLIINNTSIRIYLMYLGTLALLLMLYFGISYVSPVSTLKNRSSELVFSNINRFTEKVNQERRISIQSPVNQVFYNKYALLGKEIVNKYLGIWSLDFLFISGDPRATYRLEDHGMLYVLDAPFLILGLIGLTKLFQKKNFLGPLILGMLILAPVISTVSQVETSYIFRSFLMLPALMLLNSAGIYFVYIKKPVILILIGAVYVIFFVNFLHFYFYSYPVTHQEAQFLSERIMVNYLARTNHQPIVVVTSPKQITQQETFFSGSVQSLITTDCKLAIGSTVLMQNGVHCSLQNNLPKNYIQDQKDAATLVTIYGDSLCQNYNLTPWRENAKIGDYAIEKLSTRKFCERWIAK